MTYEVTGTPVIFTVTAGNSARAALPALPACFGAIRLTVDKPSFFAFGDNTVVADDDADSSALFGTASIEYVRPLAGATHIAVWSGDNARVTVTPIRTL